MSKKETVTLKEIEHDIKKNLKAGQKMTKSEYLKMAIPCMILAVTAVILSFFQPLIELVVSFLFIIVAIIYIMIAVIQILIRKHKGNRICMDNYEVLYAVFSHTEEEHYIRTGYHYHKKIDIYTLCFENGMSWRVPEWNYTWSQEFTMSDFTISVTSHPGDTFVVVLNKNTRDIVMAYPTEFFEYKA